VNYKFVVFFCEKLQKELKGILMRAIGFCSLVFGLVFANIPHLANAQNGASFDCAMAKTIIEKKVCNNPEISQMDNSISQLFKGAKVSALGYGASNQLQQQRDWIKARNNCINSNDNVDNCLKYQHSSRIIELAVANLFTDYANSIAQIEKIQPANVPFYRAIHSYIALLQSNSRDTAILEDLKPFYNKIQKDYEYPASVLADEVKIFADIVKSDKSFGTSITILGIASDEQLIMPCAAIYKKPEIISVLSAYFGSSYDGQLIRDDCDANLPPLPKFNALNGKIINAMPICEGTMRFAVYRENAKNFSAIKLGRFDLLADKKSLAKKQSAKTMKFTIKNANLYNAALSELVIYYQNYFPSKKITKEQIGQILRNYIDDNLTGC
jgi:uncharacterized protein